MPSWLKHLPLIPGKKSEEGRQQAVNQEDLAANEVPADGNAPDAPSNLPEGDVSEDILLENQAGSCHVRRDPASGSASNKDTTAAAVTADTEEKTNLLSDSKEDSDETKSTESDKDKWIRSGIRAGADREATTEVKGLWQETANTYSMCKDFPSYIRVERSLNRCVLCLCPTLCP